MLLFRKHIWSHGGSSISRALVKAKDLGLIFQNPFRKYKCSHTKLVISVLDRLRHMDFWWLLGIRYSLLGEFRSQRHSISKTNAKGHEKQHSSLTSGFHMRVHPYTPKPGDTKTKAHKYACSHTCTKENNRKSLKLLEESDATSSNSWSC